MSEVEKTIGIFRESRWNFMFWVKAIFSLGLYWFLYHRFNEIELTTRRVTQRRGNILSQNETSVAIQNVTDVTLNRSALGGILGYGDIVIQSAGSGASEIAQVRLGGAEKLKEAIFDLRDGKFDETKL